MRLVTSGIAALECLAGYQLDLIVLDLMMPEMDSYEVCARLKADPAYRGIPAIVLSACDEPFDKVKAFRLGAADYLTKPLQCDETIARIEHQLALRRLQQEVAAQRDQLQAQNERLRAEIQARQQAQAET